jgi:chemotaxis protein methyltransferase CheR
MAFTFFFRDRQTLDLVAEHVIPALKRHMYINVWDAGCAMGPEPYSIAITLRENMGPFLFRNVRIYATDIDESGRFGEVIARGVYPAERVKRIPQDLLHRYFAPRGDGHFQICEEMRQAVDYQRHDLLSLKPIREGFGLIVCKNVLLHFTPRERADVVRTFHRALSEGGYFCTEQTQTLPPECLHLFRRVTGAGQVFQKVAREQGAEAGGQGIGGERASCQGAPVECHEQSARPGFRECSATTSVQIRRDEAFERVSRYTWFNLEVGDDRVGKARVSISGDRLTIHSLSIYPEYEGHGYGQKVVGLFREQYREIVADRTRHAARGFWEKMGFHSDDRGNHVWQGR